MLTVWLPAYVAGEKLFPKLEKKKAWFMVKKDLERIGIPYENEDGIADFHATGRHTYITGLLTNGTSIVDAMEVGTPQRRPDDDAVHTYWARYSGKRD